MLRNFVNHIVPQYEKLFNVKGARKHAAHLMHESKSNLRYRPSFTSKTSTSKRRLSDDTEGGPKKKKSKTTGEERVTESHACTLREYGYSVEARQKGRELSGFDDNVTAPDLIGLVRIHRSGLGLDACHIGYR